MTDSRKLNRNYLLRKAVWHYQGDYISTDAEEAFLTGLLNDAMSVPGSNLAEREKTCQDLHSRWIKQCTRAHDHRTAALNSLDERQADAMWGRAYTYETLAAQLSESLRNERDALVLQGSRVLAKEIANY